MTRFVAWAGAAVALTLWSAGASADSRECRASKALLDLGNPLEIARTAVADEHELRIVAMGSSSTQGYGTTNPQFAYPFQLKMKLTAALPGVDIHVYNKGIGGQDADEMAARMRSDVKPERAHLVIWQVGTNSAIGRVPLGFSAAPASGSSAGRATIEERIPDIFIGWALMSGRARFAPQASQGKRDQLRGPAVMWLRKVRGSLILRIGSRLPPVPRTTIVP